MKADYSKIASFYDKGREHSERNMAMWLDHISKFTRHFKSVSALDLGCGTGRFALPIAEQLGFKVTGVDASPEMLEKAERKDRQGKINWVPSDAHDLSLPANAFELVFISHLLHHLDDPLMVLRECIRVLIPSGVILILHGTIEQIRKDVAHTFFHETLDIDEKRIPSTVQVEEWLEEAGFTEIWSEEIIQQTWECAEDRLAAKRLKNTSVLTMISEQDFQKGIARLEDYVKMHPDDPWLMHDKLTITKGLKAHQ